MLITSVDNKKIKDYVSLKTSKGRKEKGLFLVEGSHLCEEAEKSGLLQELLVLDKMKLEFDTNKEIIYVTENVMKKISNLTNIPMVIGVCKIKENKKIEGNHILLLDNIQDPGNIGTIIRSAKAFNVDTIVLSDDSVDIYNDKVLRSTQGMLFHSNIIYDNLTNVINKLKKENYLILGTDVNNGTDVRDIKVDKYALIMGNEGHGVRKEIKEICDKNLYIKMNNSCESLNVAVATSILLYELNRSNHE